MFFPRAKADRQIGGIPTVAFRPRSWRRFTTFRTRDISYTQTKQMTFSCLLEPDSKVIAQSTNRHSTTWLSHHRAFHQSTHYHMAITSSSIPPVNTLSHGYHIIEHSTSQHTTTWLSHHRAFHSQHTTTWLSHHRAFHSQHTTTWLSHHRAFHQSTHYHMAITSSCIPQSTHYHMAITSSCIPPVNTLSHGYHIIVHSTSQHTTTWLSHHRAFHSQHTITWLSHHRAFHSQHTTTWLSHHRAFHQSTHYHMAVTSSIPPVNTLSHGYHILEHPTSQYTTTCCQIIEHSTSQYTTTCCQIIEHSTSQYTTTCCQIIVHPTSQYTTTRWQ